MRADGPDLLQVYPPCPICGFEVDQYWVGEFICISCGATWDDNGEFVKWESPEAEQCPATELNPPKQCLLEAGHGGRHYCIGGSFVVK